MLLITLNRNPNALPHLWGPVWSEPSLPLSLHGVPPPSFHPAHWSLSFYNTTHPSYLGASASGWNDLPSFPMTSPLEGIGEAFTEHPPLKYFFSPHLESHHHVFFLLNTEHK